MRSFRYIVALTIFTAISILGYSQNFDDIFDNGHANSNNSIYFSSCDFIRGVPAIYYKYDFLTDNNHSSGIFFKIGGGIQLFKPLTPWVPYYTHNLEFSYWDSWGYYTVNINDIEKTKFLEFSIGTFNTDWFFGTENQIEGTLNYRVESFTIDNENIQIHNFTIGYGYNFLISTRFHILLEPQLGFGLAKYQTENEFIFSYMINLDLGYSF